MSFDHEIRDALRAEADRIAPAADAWERAEAAAMAPPPRRPGRWLFAAAAAVLVVAAIVGATTLGDDEQGVDSVDQPGPSTTALPATTGTTAVVDVTGRPDELVAIDATGHLIVVDLETGETIRELAYIGNPSAVPDEGPPSFISDVEVSPDRDWVYYGTCCDPAVGSIFRVPYEGGESELVMDGSYPAISSDGQLIAASMYGYGVLVRAVEALQPQLVAEALEIREASRLGWSVDGTGLYADRFVGDVTTQIVVYDFEGSSLAFRRVLSPPAGQGWSSPVGRADGNVLVVANATDGSGDSVATVLDPETGEVVASFELGGQAHSFAYDSTGTWLIVTLGRLVRWFGADGSGEIPGAAGWLDADW